MYKAERLITPKPVAEANAALERINSSNLSVDWNQDELTLYLEGKTSPMHWGSYPGPTRPAYLAVIMPAFDSSYWYSRLKCGASIQIVEVHLRLVYANELQSKSG